VGASAVAALLVLVMSCPRMPRSALTAELYHCGAQLRSSAA
jgi:hypothetical protein